MRGTRFLSILSPALELRPSIRPGFARSPRHSNERAPPRRHFQRTRPHPIQPAPSPAPLDPPADASPNQPLSFPCLDAVELRSASLSQRFSSSTTSTTTTSSSSTGPEPSYTTGAHQTFHSPTPLLLDWGGLLPSFDLAYETWGTLNADRSNAILLHTGLSASSHAASTPSNPKPGWWEKFIGPGAPLDTDKYFIICTNVLGGCYGSTGPSSIDPSTTSQGQGQGQGQGQRYATRFPILTMEDMVRSQFRLLDHLHIQTLYASVGASMGGMQSLAAGILHPSRVSRIVSISGCARSHPYSIALRHVQRQVLMNDPHWRRGQYYAPGCIPPHTGMKLARQIATVTYRSGPEWEARFGRRRVDEARPPALCPDFAIETYLDHAGEKWCLEYDANSLLYISKAMDLFDLGAGQQGRTRERRRANEAMLARRGRGGEVDGVREGVGKSGEGALCTLTLPEQPYTEHEPSPSSTKSSTQNNTDPDPKQADLTQGLSPLSHTPALILGVASDILFPAWQQREVADTLRQTGNNSVEYMELGEERSLFGHDTFLLDLEGVGGALGRWLG